MTCSAFRTRIDFEKKKSPSSELLSLTKRENLLISSFRKLSPEKQKNLIKLFTD